MLLILLNLNSANYPYLNQQTNSNQMAKGLKLSCISLSLTLVVSLSCKMVYIWNGVFVVSRASSSETSRVLCWPGGFWKPSPTFKA